MDRYEAESAEWVDDWGNTHTTKKYVELVRYRAVCAQRDALLAALEAAPDPFAPVFKDGGPSIRLLCQKWWTGQRQTALALVRGVG